VNDPEIRALLRPRLTGLVINEVDLRASAVRADVVVVNDDLHGYEIKSAVDSRARLPRQAEGYSRVFDFATLVTEPKHLRAALAILPPWWGVLVVEDGSLHEHRAAEQHGPDPAALARMLWRDEGVAALRAHGVAVGNRVLVSRLWPLVEALPLDVLRAAVREALKVRRGGEEQSPAQVGLFGAVRATP
jgi:hypothetical protein